MPSETEKAVDSALERYGVTFQATGGSLTERDKWECFAWRVTLDPPTEGAFVTDFYCGTGHAKKTKLQPWEKATPKRVAGKPIPPTAASVISSLLLDAQANDGSFNDWCSNYGYDNDSIKAFALYQKCCTIGKDLRKVFTAEQRAELSKLLEDY